MTKRTIFSRFVSGLLIFLVPVMMSARSGQDQDLVNVEPQRCLLGGTVKVFGWVKPNHPGATYVNLDFFKPVSGKTISQKVRTDPNGKYNFLFKQTDETGMWRVEARKEGTPLKKEVTFEVSHTVFLVPLSQEIKSLGSEITEAYNFLKTTVENYPDFPDKDDILHDIAELLNHLDQMAASLDTLESHVQQMNSSLQVHAPNLPDPAKQQLIEAGNKANTVIQETRNQNSETREVLEKSKQAADWCYIWMAYYDLCAQLKFYNNFLAGSLKGIAMNLLQAKLTQGLDPNLQNLIAKVFDAIGGPPNTPLDIANKIMGKMADLGSKVYDQLLKNCTTYMGEAEGQYHTQLLHKNMTFYTMSYKLSGKVELTFQERKPGDPAVYLKGRFKGKAHDFGCSITMAPFAVPDTIGPVWCLAATPLIANRSFLLYLEGKAHDDRMELKLEKTGRDFDLKSRAFYVMLTSATYNLPIPGDFSFPLQDAEWFLTRVTQISNPSIEYFEIPIQAQGDTSKAEKEFERTIYLPETSKRVGVNVHMKLKITICSPKCK